MNPARIRTVTRRLAAIPPGRDARSASDADLLGRFLNGHDESAFETLVARHMPAVRAVCQSLLRDANDADDAVQATFLVLVRRASAVRDRLALGAWLCRVAWRTANRLRGTNIRHGERISPRDPDTTPGREEAPARESEVTEAIHDEIARLPERYRLAVLTCYAAGTSTAEAATRLGWPKGTLLTRLAWARKRLRERLTKRGVTLANGFTAIFAGQSRSAVGAVLAGRITAAAVAVVSGDTVAVKERVAERVSSLTEGVVRTMIRTKIKIAVGFGFLAVALLGLGRMTVSPADAADQKKLTPAAATTAKRGELRDAEPDQPKTELPAAPAGPGNDLTVRRPLGSFTREVPAYGKATLTFTENRLRVVANIRIENVTFTVTADADYSLNCESMVYGIITGADLDSPIDAEGLMEIKMLVGATSDAPFAFRIRVEDDAITLKDLKFGPIGSPLFAEMFGNNGEASMFWPALVGGKYKADPNSERNPQPLSPRKK